MNKTQPIQTKYYNFDELVGAQETPGFLGKASAQLNKMYATAKLFKKPTIVELGTNKGESTTIFLQACQENGGNLVSIDIRDCSDLSDSENWTFMMSDSTDAKGIVAANPCLHDGLDILYIDSLHNWKHVEKEITNWFPFMKKNSWVFFDDVDSAPYRKGARKDNIKGEIEFDKIHQFVMDFYCSNEEMLSLNIDYGSTGLATIHKRSELGTPANKTIPIIHRKYSLLNRLKNM